MVATLRHLTNHAFLAHILGTFQRKDDARRYAVLNEEFCLELTLREVFEENAWASFFRKPLDESDSLGLFTALTKVLITDKAIVIQQLHVSALAKSLAEA